MADTRVRANNKSVEFARDFETASLDELKSRYDAGERPADSAYNIITFREIPDQLEVFNWLLNTGFGAPRGDFWMYAADTDMAVEYANAIIKIYPDLPYDRIMHHAIDNHNKALVNFAALRIGWSFEHLAKIDKHLFDRDNSDPYYVNALHLRNWFLKKSGYSETSYMRWERNQPYEKLV